MRDRAVQFAPSDAPGDRGGGRDRAGDAAGEQPRHQRGEQQRGPRAREVELRVGRDRSARALAVGEPVPGSIVDQQVDLLIDGRGRAVERPPGLLGRGVWRTAAGARLPRSSTACRALAAACAARGDCERSAAIVRSSSSEFASASILLIEVDLCLRTSSTPASCERGLHGGEVGRGRAGVIDRHQGFVEGLRDQHAGVPDLQGRVAAQRAGDHAHCEECEQDLAADRSQSSRPLRSRRQSSPATTIVAPRPAST